MSGTNQTYVLDKRDLPDEFRSSPGQSGHFSAQLHSKFAILSRLSLGLVGFVPGTIIPRGASERHIVVLLSFYWSSLLPMMVNKKASKDGSGLPLTPRILRNLWGCSAGGFCRRVCIVENLMKNPHTETEIFCRTLGAKPSFSDSGRVRPQQGTKKLQFGANFSTTLVITMITCNYFCFRELIF